MCPEVVQLCLLYNIQQQKYQPDVRQSSKQYVVQVVLSYNPKLRKETTGTCNDQALVYLALLSTSLSVAADLPENASIYLVNPDNQETRIGDVGFSKAENDEFAVQVSIDTSVFTEHFYRCVRSVA